jgi:hypothetical protein
MKTTKKAKFDFRTIDSFEAACKKQNIDPTALPEVSMLPERFQKAIVAVYKLFIIFEAVNDGWVCRPGDTSQNKYSPWLPVLSSGFGFGVSGYRYSYTTTDVGSRLCTETPEQSIFIGETFGVLGQEYKDFFLQTQ